MQIEYGCVDCKFRNLSDGHYFDGALVTKVFIFIFRNIVAKVCPTLNEWSWKVVALHEYPFFLGYAMTGPLGDNDPDASLPAAVPQSITSNV